MVTQTASQAAIAVHAPGDKFAISLARSSNHSEIPTRR
jgi:hypothetical protein